MAAQDFDINIRTLADTTGIKLTQAQLESLQTAAAQGNQKAAAALKQLAEAQSASQAISLVGIGAMATGVGILSSLATVALSEWIKLNDEQDRMVEGMIKAEEKARALGESILAIQDAARSAARIGTEPLEQSLARLTHEIAVLKTEQSLLNLPEQGEEWKKINAQISVNEGLLNRVTSSMQRQKDEAAKLKKEKDKATEKELSARREFEQSALTSSAPNVQRVLQNEAMARRTGDQMFQKSAEAYERGLSPDQKTELEQLRVLEQIREAWR